MKTSISSRHKSTLGVIGALALMSAALSGCASLEKCGVEGCPGDKKIAANVEAQLAKHPELRDAV
jgi:hypothetical protein